MDCCKVGVVTDKRKLAVSADDDFHEYLVARWLGSEGYPTMGVRKLADWFNKKLLREVYTEHNRTVTDIRISSEYDALRGDDTVKKGEVVDDLKADGIDGEELLDDFVSRSTMRRHLTDCLGASKETANAGSSDSNWEVEQIRHSKDHLETKVEESVRSLANKEQLPGGDEADTEIAIFLSCPECSTRVRLQTALDREFICREHLGDAPLAGSDTVVQ